jgi:serine O-acetyltransferase
LYTHKIPFLPKLIYYLIRIIFACDLPYTARIGNNVGFFHNGLGVVIHRNTVIGQGTYIYQNVTIGGNGKTAALNGVPTIGENVFIGAGAVIMGPITIGNNAKIGANAVVTKSVPEYGVALGAPAKIVRIENVSEQKNQE